jgi:hypothetical protein
VLLADVQAWHHGAVPDQKRHLAQRAGPCGEPGAVVTVAGHQVGPLPRRQPECPVHGIGAVTEHRCHQQVVAEQEGVVDGSTDPVGRVVEVEWSEHRPAPVGALERGLPQVGQQAVAQSDPITRQAQRLLAERPRLTRPEPVGPHQRRQCTELGPADVQGGGELGAEESADVVRDHLDGHACI